MARSSDCYIKALEFAESRIEFTLQELAVALDLTEIQQQQFANQIHEKQIFQHSGSDFANNWKKSSIKLHLSVDDKFRLISYRELEDARASSKQATCFAIAALVVSIASSAISAALSIQQIKSDINIPKNVVSSIDGMVKGQLESNKHLSKIEKTVDTFQKEKAAHGGE